MTLAIIIDQAGKPAGVAGQAREDLVTGVPVVASFTGGPFLHQFWSLSDRPIQYVPPQLSAAGCQTPMAASTLISPIDNEGTYLLKLVVDSGQGLGATPADVANITFYAGATLNIDPTALPRRVPAFGEQLEHNVPDTIQGGPNARGWAEELGRWFEVMKAAAKGGTFGWARVQLTSMGATILQQNNIASVVRTSVGTVLVTFISPASSVNYGVVGSARGGVGGGITGYNEGLSTCSISRGDSSGTAVDEDFSFLVLNR